MNTALDDTSQTLSAARDAFQHVGRMLVKNQPGGLAWSARPSSSWRRWWSWPSWPGRPSPSRSRNGGATPPLYMPGHSARTVVGRPGLTAGAPPGPAWGSRIRARKVWKDCTTLMRGKWICGSGSTYIDRSGTQAVLLLAGVVHPDVGR